MKFHRTLIKFAKILTSDRRIISQSFLWIEFLWKIYPVVLCQVFDDSSTLQTLTHFEKNKTKNKQKKQLTIRSENKSLNSKVARSWLQIIIPPLNWFHYWKLTRVKHVILTRNPQDSHHGNTNQIENGTISQKLTKLRLCIITSWHQNQLVDKW